MRFILAASALFASAKSATGFVLSPRSAFASGGEKSGGPCCFFFGKALARLLCLLQLPSWFREHSPLCLLHFGASDVVVAAPLELAYLLVKVRAPRATFS